jgi:hypothetical protein
MVTPAHPDVLVLHCQRRHGRRHSELGSLHPPLVQPTWQCHPGKLSILSRPPRRRWPDEQVLIIRPGGTSDGNSITAVLRRHGHPGTSLEVFSLSDRQNSLFNCWMIQTGIPIRSPHFSLLAIICVSGQSVSLFLFANPITCKRSYTLCRILSQ